MKHQETTNAQGQQFERWLSRIWLAQAVYYVVTGTWGLVHIRSFEWVTGPKQDRWLVKTVSVLVVVIGGVIGKAGASSRITPETVTLATGTAAGLTAIDVVYVARRRISPVYLLDAVANIALITGWFIAIRRKALQIAK
jgi:hypothetical protein